MFALVIGQKADSIAAVKSSILKHLRLTLGSGRARCRRALSGLMAILLASLTVSNSAAAEAKSCMGLKLAAQGFTSPVALAPLDGASGRLLIVDQIGAIHVLTKEGKLMDRPFLDLRGRLAKRIRVSTSVVCWAWLCILGLRRTGGCLSLTARLCGRTARLNGTTRCTFPS